MGLSHVMSSRYASLTRAELAVLVPELLLMGQMMDRAGMPWCISAFGREGMTEVAIEEWMTASPIYTRRMQQALGYAPEVAGAGDVVTIFKGLQLDIGAPPQFMDFRYGITDPWHGEFWLDHCGALMDVEPIGTGLRPRDVPRHRGPDLRRHRGGHQPAGTGPAGAPATSDLGGHRGRPASALPVDDDHRRVPSGGRVHPPVPGGHDQPGGDARPRAGGRVRRGPGGLPRPSAQRPRLRLVLPLGTRPDR